MEYITGDKLDYTEQRKAIACYVHRFTKQHKPAWVKDETKTPVQFESDFDWLKHTEFAVTKTGKLDQRVKSCWSHPTWPDNPELRK